MIAENVLPFLSIVLMALAAAQLVKRLISRFLGGECLTMKMEHRMPDRTDILLVLLLAVISRILCYMIAWQFARMYVKPGIGFFESFDDQWLHWDTHHYLGIARDGYTNVGTERLRLVFFPLYPMLIALIQPVFSGNYLISGAVISLICTAASSVLLYTLVYSEMDRRRANLAVYYFLANPFSVFLCCAYTEALFLCLTMLTVLLYRNGHPWLSALMGMLSALCRMPGVVIAGLYLVGMVESLAKRELNPKQLLRPIAQTLIVFGGLFVYWGINVRVTGSPFTYMTYQLENWHQAPGTFWQSVANSVDYFMRSMGEEDQWWIWGAQLIAIFYVLVLLVTTMRKLPFDMAAYSFVYICLVLSPTWLLSAPRYLYAMFTLPMLQASSIGNRVFHAVHIIAFCVLLVVYVYAFTTAVVVY